MTFYKCVFKLIMILDFLRKQLYIQSPLMVDIICVSLKMDGQREIQTKIVKVKLVQNHGHKSIVCT